MRQWANTLCLATLLIMTACMPKAYRVDVRQGNIITPEKTEQLSLGMNRQSVLQIMGTPVQSDLFQQQKWYYVYSNQKAGTREKVQGVILHFKDNSLSVIQSTDQAPTP